MGKQFRQGDVFIAEVDALPIGKGVQLDRDAAGRPVLAYGEKTGHAHVVEALADDIDITWVEVGGSRFFSSLGEVAVKHDEHRTLVIPAGTYEVVQQQEYTPEGLRPAYD